MSAVVVGAALVATGCSPVKMGAAAVVGNQRITVATLDTEVINLASYAKLYPGTVQLNQKQETQDTLTWLIRFQINEELARQQGITISTAQAQQALNEIFTQAKANAQAQGIKNVSLNLILTANGIPPNMATEVGRYQAIDDQFALQANGGKALSSQDQQNAVTTKLNQARCVATKQLKIQVNPQYGRLDFSQYSVVDSLPTVTRTAGPTPAASPSGLALAC